MQEAGLFYFFYVNSSVTIDGVTYQVWAKLSAEHVTDLPSKQVTYAQVVKTLGPKGIVCSVGFVNGGVQPKIRQILVSEPLSPGKREWQAISWSNRWHIDCPVDAVPPASINILMADARDMIATVLAPSFGCRVEEVTVVIEETRSPYFNPYAP